MKLDVNKIITESLSTIAEDGMPESDDVQAKLYQPNLK